MKRLFYLFVASLVPLSLAACASMSFPLEGVVIDSATGKPLPGAFVIAQTTYYGADPVGARTTCPHVAVAQADANGRFRMVDVGAPGFGNVDRVVFGYKAGYEWDGETRTGNSVVPMKAFRGTGDERAVSVRTYAALMECGAPETVSSILRPLYLAIDKELATLVTKNPRNSRGGGFEWGLRDLDESIQRKRERQTQKGSP